MVAKRPSGLCFVDRNGFACIVLLQSCFSKFCDVVRRFLDTRLLRLDQFFRFDFDVALVIGVGVVECADGRECSSSGRPDGVNRLFEYFRLVAVTSPIPTESGPETSQVSCFVQGVLGLSGRIGGARSFD